MSVNLLFLFFSINILLSCVFVITSKNPINSILFLVFVFLNSTCLLLLFQVEFLAMVLVVVYVGAIAVLFLFVIMLLNIKLIEYSDSFLKYIPIGIGIGIIFFSEIYVIYKKYFITHKWNSLEINYTNWINYIYDSNHIEVLGQILYTKYSIFFLIASIILLLAMIGAITLTHRNLVISKRQEIHKQLLRSQSHVINYI